ncbi:MAG TPA: hypothetical protein VF681_03505 [Abditibacteriaceae bacterium]|jgi:hypothetical protein
MLPAIALTPLAATASPRTLYNLGLNGSLWGNDVTSYFQFQDDRLSTLNLNVSGSGMRASAGDITAHWDALGFAGRGFRGMSLGLPTGKIETTLLGGAIVVPDLQGHEQTSAVYGIRAALPLNAGFQLSASQLWTPGAPLDQGKSLNTLGLAYQPGERRRLALELAHSEGGNGWQLSLAEQSKRLNVRASYRQVSPGFSTAGNPFLQTNRSGYFADVRYQVARPLTLTLNSQRYNDGRGGDSRFDGVSLQMAPRKLPSLTVFWQASGGVPSGALLLSPQNASLTAQSTGLRIGHSFGSTNLSLGYQRLNFRSGNRPLSDTSTDRLSFGLVRPVGKQTLLTLFHVLDSNVAGEDAGTKNGFTDLYLNRRFGRSGLSLDLGLQHQANRSLASSGQALSTRLGFRLPLKGGSSVGVAYRTRLSASGSLRAQTPPDLYLSYAHGFQIGKRRRSSVLPVAEQKRLGGVIGRVFDDSNGDGKWQEGEAAVPDVAVAVRFDMKSQTGESGRYAIKELRPGDYRLQLVMKTLPIEFTLLAPAEVPLQILPSKTSTVDFAVVRSGQIRGHVFRDENRNGQQDSGEAGVASAIVRIEGSDIISFSNERGEFTLSGVPPRQWKISLDQASLGENLEATGPGVAELNVPPNGDLKGIALGIAVREREIVSTFEKSQ